MSASGTQYRRARSAASRPIDGDSGKELHGRDGGQGSGRRERAAIAAAATVLGEALHLLARRSYTEVRLRERLERRWDASATDGALRRLRELGLVDDDAWAERFCIDRFQRLGRGRHRILAELVARGIEPERAAQVVGRLIDPQSERERAAAVLADLLGRRGAAGLRGSGDHQRASAMRRLLARGFPASLVRDLLGGS